MQFNPSPPAAGRPRRQIHPPAYLQDYDLSHAFQPFEPYTAQHTWGTEERPPHPLETGVQMETQSSSRAESPISQNGADPMEALMTSLEGSLYQASKPNLEPRNHGPGPPNPLPQSYPYHRPWEQTPQQLTSEPVSGYGYQPPVHPAHFITRPGSRPHYSTSQSPPSQSPQYPTQPDFNYSSQMDQVARHQPYSSQTIPDMTLYEDASRNPGLYDLLGRMMSELQIMREKVASPAPIKPQSTMLHQAPKRPAYEAPTRTFTDVPYQYPPPPDLH